jgi:hypothetical protein
MTMPSWIPCLALAAVAALASSGCDDPSPSLASPDDDSAAESRTVVGSELARIDGADGRTLTFLDLGDGDIGVLEARSSGQRSGLLSLKTEDASPLEIYMAAEGADPAVIARLRTNHDALGKDTPRPLKANPMIPLVPLDLSTQGYKDIENYCNDPDWGDQWEDDLDPLSQYHVSAFRSNVTLGAAYYFYPGPSDNTATWLGICTKDQGNRAKDGKEFTVQKLTTTTWTDTMVAYRQLDASAPANSYVFYTTSPGGARYRGKVTPWSPVNNSTDTQTGTSYGIAVAYTQYIINP